MSRFERYQFDVEELNATKTAEAIFTYLGVLGLGVAIGMKLMATFLLKQFCLRAITFEGTNFIGGGCTTARRIATEQTVQWLTLGLVLLAVGVFIMVVWGDRDG